MLCKFFLFTFCNLFLLSNCARILFIPGHNAVSRVKSMYFAAEALKKVGHDIFILQLVNNPKFECKNEIGATDLVIQAINGRSNGPSQTWSPQSMPYFIFHGWKHITEVCMEILSHESTRNKFYSIFNEKWDVVILDDFSPICGLMAIQKGLINRNTVIIDFSTMSLYPKSVQLKGAGFRIPIDTMLAQPNFDLANFFHRVQATVHNLQMITVRWTIDGLISYVGLSGVHLDILPDKSHLAVSSIPTRFDFTLPKTFDVGDFERDCFRETSPIPEPFFSFINDPKSAGTILFATGHFVDWKNSPTGAIEAFVNTFATLGRYRIIWQYPSNMDKPADLPGNVMLGQWIPQRLILHHPRTKLFISHMGLKSLMETICAGVPVAAMPIAADQFRNTALAQKRGFAVYIDKTRLTMEKVYPAIKRVLDDEKYTRAIQKLHKQIEDRIGNGSSLFTFQIEFMMRRNDEKILQKYIKTKWNRMSVMSRWNADFVIIWAVFLLLSFKIVI